MDGTHDFDVFKSRVWSASWVFSRCCGFWFASGSPLPATHWTHFTGYGVYQALSKILWQNSIFHQADM